MSINFEKFANEGNAFVRQLASELGHPNDVGQTSILLRAVLHAVRDRIQFQESLHLLAQLPLFLKGIYVEGWTYKEPDTDTDTLEDFKTAVKEGQATYGEKQFDWSTSTEELISKVLLSLGTHFLSKGQLSHVAGQLPQDLKPLFPTT